MKKILFILLCFVQIQAYSQSKTVWMMDADEFFEKEDYYNALLNYQLMLNDTSAVNAMVLPYEVQITNQKLTKKSQEIDGRSVSLYDYAIHQIAVCHLKTFDYKKAEEYLKQSSEIVGYPEDRFFYANTLKNNKKYEEAIEQYEMFIRSQNESDSLMRTAELSLKGCFYATDEASMKLDVDIKMADTSVFNKGTSAFAASFFGNENRVMFTSARENGVILDPEQKSEFLCDVYWTERNSEGVWGPANNFGRPLNSAQHDGASAVNNSNVIYYTRWSDDNQKNKSIYLARMQNFKFFEAYKLGLKVNIEGYKSMQPFVSMDGKTLFFSSDRPGGNGGLDIWKVGLDSLGQVVGEPKNLGNPINTEADEVTPFFHESSSTLFFSSTGFNSIGGLDVFKSSYDVENESYGQPENLGLPINSSYDDAYLVWDSKLKYGYFSSDREPCDNGHCYDIYEVNNAPIRIHLEGIAYDALTEKFLPETTLTFKDIDGVEESFTLTTNENGYYEKTLRAGQEIFIKAQKKTYFADADVVNTKSITESTNLIQDFYLNPIPQDDIEIEGIEYDFDSDKLRPASMAILDRLFDFLELNQNLEVEINSHTDFRGSDTYNQKLSARRAKSCVDYLLSKGVSTDRLTSKGYGESEPIFLKGEDKQAALDAEGNRILLTEEYIKSIDDKDQQEVLHQLNRRTSFKVTGEDFKVISK
jgi:OOP family OmpA-OmpF porin